MVAYVFFSSGYYSIYGYNCNVINYNINNDDLLLVGPPIPIFNN